MADADWFKQFEAAPPAAASAGSGDGTDWFAQFHADEPAAAPQSQAIDFSGESPQLQLDVPKPSEEEELAKDDRARRWFERAQGGDPSHEIEAFDLATASGAPLQTVRERIDDFRKTYKAAGTDYRKWRQDNPDLEYLLTQTPEMAPVVTKEQTRYRTVVNPDYEQYEKEHPFLSALGFAASIDPLDPLGSAEEADLRVGKTEKVKETQQVAMQDLSHLSTGEAVVDAAKRGAKQNWISKQGFTRAWTDITAPDSDTARSLRENILEQKQALGLPAFYGDGIGKRLATTTAEATTGQIDSAAALALGAVVGAVTRRPGLVGKVAKIAGAPASFVTETGGAYNDFADTLDDQGKPIDKRIAFAAAHMYGALATAIETGVLGSEANRITAVDAKRFFASALADKTKRGIFLNFAKTLAKNAGSEAAEEGAQEALQVAAGYVAQTASAGAPQSFDKDASITRIFASSLQGALGSIAGIGGVTLASQTVTQLQDIGASHRAGAHVAAITDVAKDKTAKAAPKQVANWIASQQQADGRRVTHLYVDPHRLVEEATKGGAKPEQVATELMGEDGPRRLQDALDTAGDAAGARATLEVPVAEYLEKWGGKPIAESLAEDVSTGPGLQTMRELRLFQSDVQAHADAIANGEQIEGATPQETALVGSLEQQLVAAGRPAREAKHEVAIVHAMAIRLAQQSGRTTEEVLAEMPTVTAVNTGGQTQAAETLSQPSLDTMAVHLQPASAPTLRQDFSALSPLEQQQRYFRDRNTGLQNFRALETSFQDQSNQHFATFALEGTKYLNDQFGHGSVDGALRRMADAIRSVVPSGGAKVGGDLGVFVKDDAQAQQIRDAMQAALPGGVQITYDIGQRHDTLKKTIDEVQKSHKAKRLALEQAGTLAKRGEAPVSLQGDAAIAQPVAESMTATPVSTVPTALAATHEKQFANDKTAFETAHLDPSGLLNDDGFAQARANPKTRKKFVMSADLRGFAGMNEAFGREATDAIKAFFNERMFSLGAGAFDTANLHGDEYAAQGDDSAEMAEYFAQTQEEMRRVILWDRNTDGSFSLQLGLHFAYGIDSDEDVADRVKLKEDKQRQDAGGRVRGIERVDSLEDLERRVSAYAQSFGIDKLDRVRVRDLVREQLQGRSAQAQSGAGGQAVRTQADQVASAATERLEQSHWYNASAPAERRESLDLANPIGDQPRVVLSRLADAGLVSGAGGTQETGQQLVDRLNRTTKGGASEVLKAAGVPIRSSERLFQGEDTSPRGWIDIVRDGAKAQYKVFLTKKADASTFLHESAHAYLEMATELAAAPDANPRLLSDFAAIRKWLGAEEGKAFTVEQKEKFARGFEAYLLEGKTPSSALAEAFASFRRWLTEIYKSVAALGVELDDNIRGVFDRMLATDAEIDRARSAAGLAKPVFSTPEQAGVDPKDFDAYLAAQERIRSDVIARTQRMIYEGQLREAKAFKTEEFRRFKEQFGDEWDQMPQVRAWRYLRLGEVTMPDGSIVRDNEQGKLDRDAVIQLVGKDHPIVKRLTGRLVKNGEDPIEASDMFGFASARTMIETLAGLPDKDVWVKSEAERAMKDAHPEIDGEIDNLQAAIQKLLHEDKYDQAEREWQMIKARTRDPVTVEALKRSAKDKVANQLVGRLDPGVVLNRERTFATMAAQAAAEGNWARAMAFKHRQLLHKFMWRELNDAKDMRDKFYDLASDMLSDKHRSQLGKAGPEYRDVVDSLLEAIQATQPRETDTRRKSLGELLARMDADGNSVSFDEDFIDDLLQAREPKSWKELKVSELQMVLDALRNIKSSARNMTTSLQDGKRVDREKLVAELIASANANVKRTRTLSSSAQAESFFQKAIAVGEAYDGMNLRPETMLEWLGGDDIDSPWHALVKTLQDAKHRQSDLMAKTVKPISELFDKIPKSVRRRLRERVDGRALFPNHRKDLSPPSQRFELLMLALNAGNESNLERLLEGRGISPTELHSALSLLTKEELDWVQAVWDQIESLWSEVRDLEERDTGLVPPKIAPVPLRLTTSDGKQVSLRGGYFPAVYDGRVSGAGERVDLRNAADALDISLTRPSTNRSHTKGRADKFADVISLNPATIQSHLVRVTHDIAYREAIRSAASIVLDPNIKRTLREKLGPERAKVFEPWLRDIGRLEAAQAESHGGAFTQTLRYFRSNVPVVVLGHAIDNYLGDTTGLLTAVIGSGLSKRHYAAGLTQFAKSAKASREFALAKSGELRSRGDDTYQGFQRRVRSLAQGRVAQIEGVIKEHAFFFAEQLEKAIVTPVWLGAYRQAQANGMTEEKAVDFADSIVRRSFPSKNVVDKSAIQRDKGVLGFMSMFVGYANWAYNQYRRIWQPVLAAEGIGDTTLAATSAMLKHLALAAVIGPVAELLVGHGPEPDEEWEQWMMRKLLIAHLLPLPLLGGFLEEKLVGHASSRTNPGLAAAESIFKAFEKAADDQAEPIDVLLEALKAYGFVRGIPVQRPVRWLEYLLESDQSNDGGVASGLLYGARQDEGGNDVQPGNLINLVDR